MRNWWFDEQTTTENYYGDTENIIRDYKREKEKGIVVREKSSAREIQIICGISRITKRLLLVFNWCLEMFGHRNSTEKAWLIEKQNYV